MRHKCPRKEEKEEPKSKAKQEEKEEAADTGDKSCGNNVDEQEQQNDMPHLSTSTEQNHGGTLHDNTRQQLCIPEHNNSPKKISLKNAPRAVVPTSSRMGSAPLGRNKNKKA